MMKRVLPHPDRILSQVTSIMHAVGWRDSRGFEAVQLDEMPIIGTLWPRCHEQTMNKPPFRSSQFVFRSHRLLIGYFSGA